MKLIKSGAVLAIAAASIFSGPGKAALGASSKAMKSLDSFRIEAEPSKSDWRYFIRAPERVREDLWLRHARAGKRLAHWSWGWRLGWVRVCGGSERPLCAEILKEALFDKALVVRAEAATRVGTRFAGSADTRVVALLEQAFRNKHNLRGGRPLFVQQRILYALHQVGDEGQRERATTLAASHKDTQTYWRRLVASTEALE
jgi:hypothetical protein